MVVALICFRLSANIYTKFHHDISVYTQVIDRSDGQTISWNSSRLISLIICLYGICISICFRLVFFCRNMMREYNYGNRWARPSCMSNHWLIKAGCENKLDVWMLLGVTQKNYMYQIFLCESLLNRKNSIDFGSGWLLELVGHLRQSQAKTMLLESRWAGPNGVPGLTVREVMLRNWWDW